MQPDQCTPARPCQNWRTCPACGTTRQAKIASAAADIERALGPLTWTRITPHEQTPEGIASARRRWRDIAKPPAAIWTVEQGELRNQLHINLLHTTGPLTRLAGASLWSQVNIRSSRHAGAYISKPDQAPRQDRYAGRTYGKLGPLWPHLVGARRYPLIPAIAAQLAIDRSAWRDPSLLANHVPLPGGPKDHAYFRAIAARYLPDLLDAIRTPTPAK